MPIKTDISYIDGVEEAILDLYQPSCAAPAEGYPGVVVIHGGGWHGGDKSQLRQTQMSEIFCDNGYVVININYSLAPKEGADRGEKIRNAFLECRQAVHWLRSHAQEFQLNAKRIGAIGGSAGGNLSLMLGVSHHSNDFDIDGIGDTSVQAVINLYGPTTRPPELKVVDYITKDCPPILSLHGTDDQTVDIDNLHALDAALEKAHIDHQSIIVEGAPHTFNLISDWGDYSSTALAFFDKHLKS